MLWTAENSEQLSLVGDDRTQEQKSENGVDSKRNCHFIFDNRACFTHFAQNRSVELQGFRIQLLKLLNKSLQEFLSISSLSN